MTNDEVHGHLVEWLAGLTGLVVIKDRQQANRPARPYAMVDLISWSDMYEHEAGVVYEDLETENSAGLKEVQVTPQTEMEWTFILTVYGQRAAEAFRRLQSAVHVRQAQEPLLSLGLFLHEISSPNNVPELIDEKWEPRSLANLTVRGMVGEGGNVVVDTIEEHSFNFQQEGS